MKTAGHLSLAWGRARTPAQSWCTSRGQVRPASSQKGVPGVGSHRLLHPYGGELSPTLSWVPASPGKRVFLPLGDWGGVRLLPVHCRPAGGGPR